MDSEIEHMNETQFSSYAAHDCRHIQTHASVVVQANKYRHTLSPLLAISELSLANSNYLLAISESLHS
jgi:hypothetical protein